MQNKMKDKMADIEETKWETTWGNKAKDKVGVKAGKSRNRVKGKIMDKGETKCETNLGDKVKDKAGNEWEAEWKTKRGNKYETE